MGASCQPRDPCKPSLSKRNQPVTDRARTPTVSSTREIILGIAQRRRSSSDTRPTPLAALEPVPREEAASSSDTSPSRDSNRPPSVQPSWGAPGRHPTTTSGISDHDGVTAKKRGRKKRDMSARYPDGGSRQKTSIYPKIRALEKEALRHGFRIMCEQVAEFELRRFLADNMAVYDPDGTGWITGRITQASVGWLREPHPAHSKNPNDTDDTKEEPPAQLRQKKAVVAKDLDNSCPRCKTAETWISYGDPVSRTRTILKDGTVVLGRDTSWAPAPPTGRLESSWTPGYRKEGGLRGTVLNVVPVARQLTYLAKTNGLAKETPSSLWASTSTNNPDTKCERGTPIQSSAPRPIEERWEAWVCHCCGFVVLNYSQAEGGRTLTLSYDPLRASSGLSAGVYFLLE